MQSLDLTHVTHTTHATPPYSNLEDRGRAPSQLPLAHLVQLPPNKFEKVWSVWSVLFHYFDAASLNGMTSTNQQALTYKKYIWKILLTRHCYSIYLNSSNIINAVNVSSIYYKNVYLQIKKLKIPFNDPYFMIAAVREGHAAVVDFLVAHDSHQVNMRDDRGFSALTYAVILGHSQIVGTLLKAGAITTLVYTEGYICGRKVERIIEGSLFMIAALRGHIEVIKVLSEYKAHAEGSDLNSPTVLIQALSHFDARKNLCVNALIRYFDHPIDPLALTCKKDNGKNGSVDWVLKFLEPHLKELTSCDRATRVRIIEDAVLQGYKEAVNVLLEFTPDLEACDHAGRTALMIAGAQGNIEIVAMLLSRHANVLARDHADNSVLEYVLFSAWSIEKWKNLVDLLLKHGVNIDMPNRYGMTPLMSMVNMDRGRHDVIEALLEWGADVNAADFQGCTVLMHAVERGTVRMVQMLLNAPIPPCLEAMDHKRNTALMLAHKQNRYEMIELLTTASSRQGNCKGNCQGNYTQENCILESQRKRLRET